MEIVQEMGIPPGEGAGDLQGNDHHLGELQGILAGLQEGLHIGDDVDNAPYLPVQDAPEDIGVQEGGMVNGGNNGAALVEEGPVVEEVLAPERDDEDLPDLLDLDDDEEDEGELNLEHEVHQELEAGEDEDMAGFEFAAGRGMFSSPLLANPLFPGAQVTLKQAILAIFQFASRNKVTEEGLGDLLLLLQKVLLPAESGLPTTLYKLYDLVDLNVDDFERHVCVNGCSAFGSIDRSEWSFRLNEACSVCGEHRFQQRAGTISPRKKFYYIPMRYQLENLSASPAFWASLRRMLDEIAGGQVSELTSVWGGQLLRPFLQALPEPGDFLSNLACSVGMDGVNCFKHSTYSVIPVATKILNLHESVRTNGDFILLNAVIPGPKKPSQYAGYLQPYFEEIKASHLTMEGCAGFSLTLSMTEQDHVMMCDTTEHMGVATTRNCPRCGVAAVPNPATGRGKYITGYGNETATTAYRKSNAFTRGISLQVERGEVEPSEHGIRGPSVFARNFPDFDVCYGELIEFFHKLQIVTPSTFWKDHVFAAVPDEGPLPPWIMSRQNRAQLSQRIAAVRATHDLGVKPKDPSSERMKAKDWDVFIVTCSPLAQDLLPQVIFDIWNSFRSGYMIHLHSATVTPAQREEAALEWRRFAQQAELHMPITMMTLSTHFVAFEANLQISQTGPIRDSMSSWIERLCGTMVEDIRRRRICYLPEKTMIRAFLMRQYLLGHADEIPKFEEDHGAERRDPLLYDSEDGEGHSRAKARCTVSRRRNGICLWTTSSLAG